ncbi:MAG: hypothetical protein KAQ68_10180 [Clostridiales bacterium]|nr:hypothetical protein [Clostridiales bacterium]
MNELLKNLSLISAMCTGVALVVVLLRKVFNKNAGAWWRSIVWLLLMIRLLAPTLPNSEVSLYTLFEGNMKLPTISISVEEENHASTSEAKLIEKPDVGMENSTNVSDEDNPFAFIVNKDVSIPIDSRQVRTPIDWNVVAIVIYLCGIVASVMFLIYRYVLLAKNISSLKQVHEKSVCDLLEEVKKDMGIKRKIGLKTGMSIATPALVGIYHPTIVLPDNQQNINPEQLKLIFRHELMHYKKKDILYLWLIECVLCIHWFNPILHLLKPIIRQDIELACDERVLMKLDQSKHLSYGKVLAQTSSKQLSRMPGIMTVNMAGKNGKKLKERLKMIRDFNKKSIIAVGIIMVMIATVLLVSCTTIPKGEEPETVNSGTTNTEITKTYQISDDEIESFRAKSAYDIQKLISVDDAMIAMNNYKTAEDEVIQYNFCKKYYEDEILFFSSDKGYFYYILASDVSLIGILDWGFHKKNKILVGPISEKDANRKALEYIKEYFPNVNTNKIKIISTDYNNNSYAIEGEIYHKNIDWKQSVHVEIDGEGRFAGVYVTPLIVGTDYVISLDEARDRAYQYLLDEKQIVDPSKLSLIEQEHIQADESYMNRFIYIEDFEKRNKECYREYLISVSQINNGEYEIAIKTIASEFYVVDIDKAEEELITSFTEYYGDDVDFTILSKDLYVIDGYPEYEFVYSYLYTVNGGNTVKMTTSQFVYAETGGSINYSESSSEPVE